MRKVKSVISDGSSGADGSSSCAGRPYDRPMMHLPHLTFLRSFEAAARHMSFTAAAEELNCTQSAVSNHVRSLEDFIGRPLFVRHPRSLSLTEVGEAYLPALRRALQEIDVATQSLIMQNHKREVVISVPVSLGAGWLPGVIKGFAEAHPDIDLTLHGTVWTDVEENVSDISISVNHVDEIMPDMTKLWSEDLTLVCAPDYQVHGEAFDRAEQLYDADLIQVLGRLEYWKLAAKSLGLRDLNQHGGLRTSATNLALEMAAEGLGCVVVPRSLALTYINRGLLQEPVALNVRSPWVYCLRTKDKSLTPSVKAFMTWMLKSAEVFQGGTSQPG